MLSVRRAPPSLSLSPANRASASASPSAAAAAAAAAMARSPATTARSAAATQAARLPSAPSVPSGLPVVSPGWKGFRQSTGSHAYSASSLSLSPAGPRARR